ncbi:DNA translocase FtsK 4TM domain-containing protein [Alistipes sp.]|uniref:FtsK/SpoIIIE family DNA translocase n=1 Tax=Alistipes sp. TaxID=1872444 RepID=UPI003AF060B7
MASKNTTASGNGRQRVRRSNGDSARWIAGLVLLFVGLFATSAVLFSFFCWAPDQSGLQLSTEERATLGVEPENLCGWAGARLGMLLVDSSFGVFGILIPVMILLVGIRIIRQRPLLFNHSLLSLTLIMLLGSLTLGFVFADRWSLCASTGWGGTFGIESAALLRMHIGAIGTIILLLAGWILTGVFINRNFINTVNTAGNAMVDKSGKIVEIVKQKVVHPRGADPAAQAASDEAVKDESDGPQTPAPQPVHTAVHRSQPAQADDGQNPFLEVVPDTPVEVEIDRKAEPEAAAADTTDNTDITAAAGDDIFTEVDLSPRADRVVMGPGGLIELKPLAEKQPPAPADEGPFTEITVGGEAPEAPAPETAAEDKDAGVVVTVEAREAQLVDERAIPTESYDPLKDLVNYRKPPVTLLEDYMSDSEVSDEEIFENKSKIEDTLKNFGIPIQRIKATVGPTVTLYEIVQAQGVKISKIQGLENDIAQSLKALGIRIIAPIPGKGTIGIEVPNRDKQVVSMYSAIRSLRFQESKAELPVVIGRTIQNENYVFDLAKMPHLLVAGATGQGKSVGLNAIITSLLYRKHPAQLKFVMIDPKMVEFSLYAKIERHFLAKMESEDEAIITDPRKAVYTLNALCTEMDTRLELCKKAGARNIAEYNEKFTARRLNPLHGHRYLPYIVVVVDEFADLIMTAREVEGPVMRLAQKARAIGIHLIIATQRPDVKVITGGIKANFPARIAFRVMQMIDSRTIIDQPGANQLIGRGDMLLSKDGELTRIQCALVETKEVERVCDYISKQQGYTSAYALPDYTPDAAEGGSALGSEEAAPVRYDALFAEIARDAVSSGQISTSMIQRNYEVGFNRAGRIMMQLERAGIVGRQQGAKPRDILFHDMPSLEAKLQDLGVF